MEGGLVGAFLDMEIGVKLPGLLPAASLAAWRLALAAAKLAARDDFGAGAVEFVELSVIVIVLDVTVMVFFDDENHGIHF